MIFAATYGPVEDIEILLTLVAFIGGVFSFWNLREARGDVTYLEELGVKNGRLFLAKAMRLSEYTRLAKQVLIVILGGLAMSIESTPPAQLDSLRLALAFGLRWGLLVFAAMVTFQSIIAWEVRREFQRNNFDELPKE